MDDYVLTLDCYTSEERKAAAEGQLAGFATFILISLPQWLTHTGTQ